MPSKSTTLALLTLWVVGVGAASAQSLADVAKKERERRARNDERGVESRSFSETEIFGEEEEPATDPDDSDSATDTESDESSAASASDPFQVDLDLSTPESGADSSRPETRGEDYWRARMSAARRRVDDAKQNKAVLDGIHYVPGTSFVDENGNVIIGSLADLRKMVERADAELQSAERSLQDLTGEARRAGVPPGWLR